MKKKFDFYADPSHGWLKVPIAMLSRLGIENKISYYSYMRGGFVYLEEDDDAATFIRAYNDAYGFKPSFRSHYGDRMSKIRGYNRYNATRAA